jgi:AraC-like DNA-binding protein
MKAAIDDYFIYFPQAPSRGICPCTATAAGFTQIPPNTPYPPRRHPLDHHFTWSDGRVLHAFQLVYISHGRGTLECGPQHTRYPIEPGTLFVLFPGVWHRYAPNTKTGWTEHWLECTGPAFRHAMKVGLLREDKPVLRVGMNRDLTDAFDLCHRWARRVSPARAAALAALGLHLLATLESVESPDQPPTRAEIIIAEAQATIVERFQERLDMAELAESLTVSYSWLRQHFKKRTGLSPKQFHMQVRLKRAQDLLANTNKSVKEIADILGFDSPYHLSAQFKARSGAAPKMWRAQIYGQRSAGREA